MKRCIERCAVIALALMCATILVCPSAAHASGKTMDEQTDMLLDVLDISEWQTILDGTGVGLDMGALLDDFAHGRFDGDPSAVFSLLLAMLQSAVFSALPVMVNVLALTLLSSVLTRMRGSFITESASEAGGFIMYLLIVIPLAKTLADMMASGRDGIRDMTAFAQSVFPTLLALLASLGGASSQALLKPALLGSTTMISVLLEGFVMPVLLFAAALAVINNMTEHAPVSGLFKLLKTVASWTLGIAFTIFLGVITVEGALAAAFDGVSVRTAKYAIDNFVPVVGGMFADTVDTLLGCSVVVKNALGLTGIIAVCAICLGPVLQIFGSVVVMRLGAALMEPIADKRVAKAVADFSDILVLLCVSVLSVAAMFFVLITAVVASGNLTVMMR